ncbi:hypothetical protein MKZ38_000150 [Zalerion maritima]|uniref:Uncharacterized protein n=1 Tax=Zalerion maritima TaxID=339359 RepID=A0AAD5WLQ9_9PEZI|nr:hypothetical protein MKZ38_000150 [Zalerion maritima]
MENIQGVEELASREIPRHDSHHAGDPAEKPYPFTSVPDVNSGCVVPVAVELCSNPRVELGEAPSIPRELPADAEASYPDISQAFGNYGRAERAQDATEEPPVSPLTPRQASALLSDPTTSQVQGISPPDQSYWGLGFDFCDEPDLAELSGVGPTHAIGPGTTPSLETPTSGPRQPLPRRQVSGESYFGLDLRSTSRDKIGPNAAGSSRHYDSPPPSYHQHALFSPSEGFGGQCQQPYPPIGADESMFLSPADVFPTQQDAEVPVPSTASRELPRPPPQRLPPPSANTRKTSGDSDKTLVGSTTTESRADSDPPGHTCNVPPPNTDAEGHLTCPRFPVCEYSSRKEDAKEDTKQENRPRYRCRLCAKTFSRPDNPKNRQSKCSSPEHVSARKTLQPKGPRKRRKMAKHSGDFWCEP